MPTTPAQRDPAVRRIHFGDHRRSIHTHRGCTIDRVSLASESWQSESLQAACLKDILSTPSSIDESVGTVGVCLRAVALLATCNSDSSDFAETNASPAATNAKPTRTTCTASTQWRQHSPRRTARTRARPTSTRRPRTDHRHRHATHRCARPPSSDHHLALPRHRLGHQQPGSRTSPTCASNSAPAST